MRIALAALLIGISLVISAWIAGSALKYKSKAMETIVVTGLAEKDFIGDLIVWNGSYSKKSMDLKEAYAQLKTDENAISPPSYYNTKLNEVKMDLLAKA